LLEIREFLLLLMNVLLRLLLLGLCLLVVVGHESKLGLAMHSRVNDLRQVLLVLLLDRVDLLPRIVLDVLPLLLVLGHQLLAGFSQRGCLALLLLELKSVLSLEVLQDLLVGDKEVVEALLEFLCLLLLLVVELLVALVVCLLLIRVVLLATGQLSFMVSSHLAEFVVVYTLGLSLGVFESGLSIFKIYLFGLDVPLDPLDLLLSSVELVLHSLLIFVLELLNARFEVIDVSHVLISFSLRDQELV